MSIVLLVLFLIVFAVFNTMKVAVERWGSLPSFILHLVVCLFIGIIL